MAEEKKGSGITGKEPRIDSFEKGEKQIKQNQGTGATRKDANKK